MKKYENNNINWEWLVGSFISLKGYKLKQFLVWSESFYKKHDQI